MSWFGMNKKQQNSGSRQQQQFRQQQVETQSEAQVELLKDEVNSLFDVFRGVIKYLKSNNVNQSGLLSFNDSAVAGLKLFGVSCRGEDANTLNVVHHYFNAKKQRLGPAEQRVVKPWLDYAESALLGKKVKKLKISQITIDRAHEYMKQGGLQGFLDSYVGAEHGSNQIVGNAQQNKELLRKQNSIVAQQNQSAYQQRQGMVQCPDQNQMYQIAGGGQNIQFGSALNHPSSKYYNPQKAAAESKEQSGSMEIDQGRSNQNNNQYMNAYVKRAPKSTITVDGKRVRIQYPYPCKIIKFFPGQEIGVLYARFNDLKVKIQASNLERDPVKVSELEQAFMSSYNDNQGLGYDSVLKQQTETFQ